jgi:hypothetical protein
VCVLDMCECPKIVANVRDGMGMYAGWEIWLDGVNCAAGGGVWCKSLSLQGSNLRPQD